jgi:hypothetical protein
MKPLYAPLSLLNQVIPHLSLSAQSVFWACLQVSGVDYHCYEISTAQIRARTGIKRDETIRQAKRDIEAAGIAKFISNFEKRDGKTWRTRDTFFPTFDKWEAIDKAECLGIDAETERERQQVKRMKKAVEPELKRINKRLAEHDFSFDSIHESLQSFKELLTYSGKFEGTHYFRAKAGSVSPAFVEEQFKRHGLSIVVKAS